MKRTVTITDGITTKSFTTPTFKSVGPRKARKKMSRKQSAEYVLHLASINEGFIPARMRVLSVVDQ